MIELRVQRLGGSTEVHHLRNGTYMCGSDPSASIMLADGAVAARQLELKIEGTSVHARSVAAEPVLRMSGVEFQDRAWPSSVSINVGVFRMEWRRASGGAKALVIMDGKLQGRRYPVLGAVVTVGRSLDRTIAIDDDRVSRFHAIFRESQGVWTVEDVGSVNGTFVNGHRTKRSEVHEGDYIRIGGTLFRWSGQDAEGTTGELSSIPDQPSTPDDVTEVMSLSFADFDDPASLSKRPTRVVLPNRAGVDGQLPRRRASGSDPSSFDVAALGAGALAVGLVASAVYWLWNVVS